MNVIELDNISKIYAANNCEKSIYALKDFSIKIKKGEIVGIIGPNGSGKTTLLKIIAGILKPDSGRVIVKEKILPFIEMGSGLRLELSGKENIRMNCAMLGIPPNQIEEQMKRIISFSGLSEFIDEPVRTYSSGMKARLVFSSFLLNDFDVLLIDEAIAVGDELFRNKSFNLLQKLKNSKKTVLIVSHDLNIIQKNCNRVLYLDNGIKREYGPPEKVISKYFDDLYKRVTKRFIQKFEKVVDELKNLKNSSDVIKEEKTEDATLFEKIRAWSAEKEREKVLKRIKELEFWLEDNCYEQINILNKQLSYINENLEKSKDNRIKSRLLKQKVKILKILERILTEDYTLKKNNFEEFSKEIVLLVKNGLQVIKDKKRELFELRRYKNLIEQEVSDKSVVREQLDYIESRLQLLMLFDGRVCTNDELKKIKETAEENPHGGIQIAQDILNKKVLRIEEELVQTKFRLENKKENSVKLKNKMKKLEKQKDKILKILISIQKQLKIRRAEDTLKIIKVNLKTKIGNTYKETQTFQTHAKMKIEIEYYTEKIIKDPVFGIAFYSYDGRLIYGPNTEIDKLCLKEIGRRGKIEYTIERLPFLPGKYILTVAAHTKDNYIPYDIRNKTIIFRVMGENRENGLIHIEGRWKHFRYV
ncbi:MAG: ATP-binding cassette domain-containing protein [Candidatus Woesearchaeota archaeon]